jgi:hypothetical protein
MKTGWSSLRQTSQAEYSKEGHGSKQAVLLLLIMMMSKTWQQ